MCEKLGKDIGQEKYVWPVESGMAVRCHNTHYCTVPQNTSLQDAITHSAVTRLYSAITDYYSVVT